MRRELVRELQERAARATPTTAEEHAEGVWLRHSDDPTTWWAGASLVHGTDDLAQAVARVEDFCARHHAPARVQVCPACPPGLDDLLAARDYARSSEVSLQTAPAVRVAAHASALDVALKSDGARARAAALVDGREVAVGRAAANGGWAGVFAMATLPGERRRGAARSVLAALAGWAVSQQCPQLYLQVTLDNAPALALYRSAGFVPAATYWYRTRPLPG